MHFILASRSPARRATLESAGVHPTVIVSEVDEEAVLDALPGGRAFSGGPTTPADEVMALARAKQEAVTEILCEEDSPFQEAPSDALVVVGCDSMLELDGRMLGKPHTPDVARARIREMRGRTAVLWTGHSMARVSPARPGATRTVAGTGTASASTLVHFGDISDREIDAYVATGEPLGVAGSFTVDGLGGPFITGVTGDYHSVVGISLPLVRTMAAGLGVFWPDLWEAAG